ncbi:MAG: hypothetical protein UW64_C0016G0002 [Microgenomates group bacterium GW2011_GWC1_44_37]|nr:MAG: hypothetical protein UW56_C0025G0018 [Candidatus Collierbacteria bacterium GW2011_GWD1_44_27]KKT68543.1 MAG: hypothetical protein UW64_C0016G0002 [Microgenomates group bacterium GW2011_GWC1_44_37]
METRKYIDVKESNIGSVKKRRKKLRQMAVDLLGGKCVVCGYCKEIKALDFHHIDESTKEFGLSDRGLTRSWEKTKEEVLKCVLLCANCHREVHSGVTKLASNSQL